MHDSDLLQLQKSRSLLDFSVGNLMHFVEEGRVYDTINEYILHSDSSTKDYMGIVYFILVAVSDNKREGRRN